MLSSGVDLSVALPESALDAALTEIEGLRTALETRTTIGIAIGVVMVEKNLTTEAAFAYLVELSSHSNTKIREIATAMVEEADRRVSSTS